MSDKIKLAIYICIYYCHALPMNRSRGGTRRR